MCPFCNSELVVKLSNMERCQQCGKQWNQEPPTGTPAQAEFAKQKKQLGDILK
jgi:transposase-like protein